MYGTRSTEKLSMTNFKTHTHNVLAFNKTCGFGKYELIFIYTNNVNITTGNFLTTNYCQLMSFSQTKMYVYFSKVNVTMYLVNHDFQIIYMPI